MVEDKVSGVGVGFSSGEVRVHGEGAEVGGDGGVGRRWEEEVLEGGGVVWMWGCVWEMKGVETKNA